MDHRSYGACDRAGVVRYAQANALTSRDYAEIITPLLNEKAPVEPLAPQVATR